MYWPDDDGSVRESAMVLSLSFMNLAQLTLLHRVHRLLFEFMVGDDDNNKLF